MTGNAVRIPPPGWFPIAWRMLLMRLSFGLHFRALRVAHIDRLPEDIGGPLVIYANHSSWWDPVPILMLQLMLLPKRVLYCPSDAVALENARQLRKMGFFPVDTGTVSGTKQFLRDCSYVLALPNAVLSITPEGMFRDPRVRPLELRRGLAALLARTGKVTVLPLALEYPFWEKKRPEILLSWGEPMLIENGRSKTVDEWQTILTDTLTRTMDELAQLSMSRDLTPFQTLVLGRIGRRNIGELWSAMKNLYKTRRASAG